MKNLKKILSVLTLIVLVGSDFLTSISYALDDMLEDSVVIQAENEEEAENVGNEEKNMDEEDSEDVYEGESMVEENEVGETVEGVPGEILEIESGELGELTEETVERVTGDVEELLGTGDENTETGEETVIEEIKYNEEPIIGEETYDDVTVKVEALSGIFPEGTELMIEPIKWGDLLDLKDKLVEEQEEIKEDTTVVAFDITFKYEGEEVQPKDGEKVKVIFDYSRNEELVNADKNENQEVKVYHIEDKDEEGNKVVQGEEKVVDVTNKQESEKNGIVVADAESFSIYALSLSKEDTLKVLDTATVTHNPDAGVSYILNGNENFTAGTITITNGTNTITMLDRNLGARAAGVGCKNSNSNCPSTDSTYGYYFQWGNNYGFDPKSTRSKSNTQVEASSLNYDPLHQQYFSSSIFIYGYNNWLNDPNVVDLWGGSVNDKSLSYPLTESDAAKRRGPCPKNFHVPSYGELNQVKSMMGDSAENAHSKLLIPFAGYHRGDFYLLGTSIHLWSSSPREFKYPVDKDKSYILNMMYKDEYDLISIFDFNRVVATPVRCFYDFYQPYTSSSRLLKVTFEPNNGDEPIIVEVESGDTVDNKSVSKDGFDFAGWYTGEDNGQTLSNTAFDFNTPITTDITLYAKWVSCENGEIYSSELGECVARWHELVSLTDDSTTTTVGLDEVVIGFPAIMTVTENTISEISGQKLAGELNIDFGGKDAKFSHLVKVKIPVEGSSKAYVKVKHVGSTKYNFDGLTTNIEASCDDGNIVNPDDMYHGEYMNVESGYVSIYTCEASDFAAFGLPKVTFEPDNGSGATVVEVENGATVNSGDIPTVTKEGYNFSGWYLTGAESAFDFSGTAITGDITLYAMWQAGEGVTYTVTFDANRGTFDDTPDAQIVTGGYYAEEPQIHPELQGYTFTGWYTAAKNGTKWNFAENAVTQDITLYAHWEYNYDVGDLDVYIVSSTGKISKYVMMDRNVGADEIYNQDFTAQNTGSFGYVYQWGNNRGFNRCRGNGTTCHGAGTPNPDKSTSKVPKLIWQEYYNSKYASGTWIAVGEKVSYLDGFGTDANLWGHETNGYDAKQGPCPDGYYVPTKTEFNEIILEWGSVYKTVKGYNITTANGFRDEPIEYFTHDFLFPLAGAHRKGQLTDSEQGGCAEYWTSVPAGTNNVSNVFFCKNGVNTYYDKSENGKYDSSGTTNNSNGSTVRCFKNTTGTANLNIVMSGGNSAVITVNKFNGVNTIVALTEPKKTDRVFGGWYTSPTFESNTMKTGGDTLLASETTLYAKWDCPEGLVYNVNNQCVSGVLVRFMDGETEYTRSVVLSGEEVRAPATNPKKAGHIFTGWFESGAQSPFIFTGTPITGNLDLYAHWEEAPQTEALITVNYYLKNLDVENNVLTGGVIKYITGVEFTGKIGDTINISGTYLTGIVGYHYDHATVFSGEDEILEDEIYLEGNKEVNMYYIPEQNQFTLNTVPYSNTDGSSVDGMYYYGAKIILSGSSSDDHYLWSGWIGLPEGTPNSAQTEFYMPNSEVTVTSSVREKTYNEYIVTFENWNGDFLRSGKVEEGVMPVYSGNNPSRPDTEESVYTFTGWYPELHPATHDETYTATYTESPRLYTITLTGTPAGYGTLSPESLSGEYGAAIVISGDKLTVGGTEVILTGNEGYEFQEWTGTCGKVEKQVCDEFIVYSHSDPIEFIGNNNIVINSEGYDLFSQSGYQKDFEISFDILNLNLTGSSNQATLLSVKNEDLNNQRPGFSFRRENSTSNLELTIRGGSAGAVTKKYTASNDVHSVKISREKGKLYISINGGNKEKVYDYSNFTNYFDKPITIGSIYQSGAYSRYIKATLSNILIKTIDTTSCYTGNLYVVTGDCQMTAKYANWAPNKYEVTGSVATGQENMGYLSGNTSTGVSLTGLYDFGTNLIFVAIPELGYLFDYWEVNGGTGEKLPEGATASGNQLTAIVNQILDIIAFFKPAENTPYTVEHYKQNLDKTGYEFDWSGTMYGITNDLTNATGTDYEGFTLSGNLVDYQTGIKADGSTVVRLYYNRNTYTVTRNMWEGHLDGRKIDENVPYGKTPVFEWDDEDKYTPKRGREVDTDDIKYDFIFTGWIKSGSTEIIKDLTTQIVTGNVTYTAQYDTGYRYYEVRYHPGEGTGSMENNNLQLYISGNLNKNTFTKTGYEFSGWMRDLGEGGEIFYEDEQEVNLGIEDVDGEAERYLLFIDLYAQWKPSTGTKVTVNYYLKDLDVDNNVLIDTTTKYATGVEFTGTADSIIDSILTAYGTGINGYEYSKSIVYGSDYPSGIETGATTVLADGSRVIDMYYVPSIYQFTLNSESHSNTAGTSENTGYYFGAKVILSGDSNDDCFTRSGWTTSGITLSDSTFHQTWFVMPANDVKMAPSTTENTYNIIFNGNGSNSGTMSPMNGIRCTESTGLAINTFEKSGHTFTGWSTTQGGIREYADRATINRLSTGADVNLYAVWDINKFEISANVATGDHGSLQWSGSGIYDFGETLVIIAVPELGYLFDYWEVTGSGDSQPIVTESGNQLTVIVDQILDIVAHFTENAKTVTVNYYEMNTGGLYSGVTNSTTFTGLVGHTGYATVNIPYGFHLDTTQTTSTGIVISNNDSENVINIYYARNQYQLNKFYTGDFQYNHNLVDFNPELKQYYYYGEHIYARVIVHTGYSVDNLTCSGGDNINIHGTEIEFDMGDKDATIIIDGNNNRYRIDYYLDGGIENPAEPNVTGYTIIDGSIQIHDPIKTGYNFLGWTGGMSGDWISTPTSGLIIDVENGLGDRQYYANWELKPYIVNVTIDPENGGTVRGTGEYHYGETFSLMATPNLGYDFMGWYTYEGYNKISDDYQIGVQADDSGGTGLIAKFELRNHYLEVIPNDWTKGSYYPEYKDYYQYGTIVPVSANPNPGYQIRGWKWNPSEDYITTGEDNHVYTGLNIDVNITWDTSIYVDFEPETYNITYMYSGEILSGDIFIPSTYTVEQNICGEYIPDGSCMYYLPIYSKDGYDFTGWYYDERTSSYSKVGLLTGMGDITLYAGLIPTTYRVYYHLGSGETLPEWYIGNYDEYTIESGRTYLPEPKKQGYDFLGWKNDNNQIITGFGGGMTGNLDLYPVWTGKVMDIEVRYHERDIDGNYNYYKHYDYTGITNSIFNIPDYTHTGFKQDRENYPDQPISIVVSGNNEANIIDVYYEREEYEITIGESEHGSVSGETGNQRYGKVITFTAHPEIGYILDKWFKNGEEIEGETENELTLAVEGGMEISGHFIAATGTEYRVEYYYQNADGSYPESATSGVIRKGTTDTMGEIVEDDKISTVSEYSFDSENEKNVLSGNINGSGDLLLRVYFKKQFTVKYLTGDKGLFDIEIYEGLDYSGNTPEFVGNTGDHMLGYTFNGWQPEVSDKVTKDESYVAQWIANTGTEYKVEYYKENLEGGYDVWTGIQYGTSDTEGVAEELIFTGFTYDSGNVNNVTTGNIDGDGSRVLVMFYTRNMNNVVYVYTGKVPTGQVAPAISGYKYEAEVSVESAPSVSGYEFSWSTGVSSFIMPDEEVVITGTWTANTGTKYVVKHILQNVENDEYTQTGENQILSGETDELTNAQANMYTGFIVQAITQTGIKGDESTVVEIYYDREIYGVTTGESEHGSISGETGNQRYGKVITFTAHPEIGYVVSRWLKNGEGILSGGVILTGEELEIEVDTGMEIGVEFKARDDIPYYVEYYKENLEGGYDVWTGTYSGTTDQEAVASELIFTGFTYNSGDERNVTTGNIDGNGSRVLKLYYNREIYTITWLNEDGTGMDTTTVKYGEIPTHADPTQPADAHYTYKFKGWDPEPTFATGKISYRATYEYIVNKYIITWKNDDGSLIDTTLVEYGVKPTHTKPTKAETEDYRYIFVGWDPEVVAVVGDAEYTAVFNAEEKEKSSKGGGMSGGGGRGNVDNSDNQHGSAEENIDGSGYTGDEVVEVDDTNKDIVPLYKWTYENDITTMDTLEDADPDGLLTRGHLAKMVVNYMVNVLGRKIPYDVTYNCRYWGDDESSWESDEIRDYATKACAFGVMGINMEDNKFLPNSIVTRAEFGTVMSRVLRGNRYDITDTDNRSYYENHLQALKKDNILTQIANPETRWEIRKWVWLVFRRIIEKYKK